MVQADKEDVQVALAPVFADSEEPTSAKSSRCQYTAKQKQRAVLYADAQRYVLFRSNTRARRPSN